MIDASSHPFDENVKITRSVVEFAQEYDASVEAEVGNMECNLLVLSAEKCC